MTETQTIEQGNEIWKEIESFNKWALDNGWRYTEGVNGTLWEKLTRDENRNVKAEYKSTFLLFQFYTFTKSDKHGTGK